MEIVLLQGQIMMHDRKPVIFIQAVFLVPRASLILYSVLNTENR